MDIIKNSLIKSIKNELRNNDICLDKLIRKLTDFKKVIVICGPTCAGKSRIGIILARLLETDIISVDSMQVYRGMDIGTDKYDLSDYGIKQYMTDIFNPDHDLSIMEFKGICDEIIKNNFFLENKIPLIVGGSGLYIRGIISGMDHMPDENKDIRKRLKEDIKNHGMEKYYSKLKKIDPNYANKISGNDQRRIIRALEVYEITGNTFSSLQNIWKNHKSDYRAISVGITLDRKKLYDNIDERVDGMFENGLVEEVKELIDNGYEKYRSVLHAVGYKEVLKYLKGEETLEKCVSDIKRNTRRLAKKQMTWFNTETKINWIRADNYDNIFKLIRDILKIIQKQINNDIKNEKN
ncbi:MAG: tRNA (adenosine(37)-N6)-dimethylallyltransferase MiaA [Actinomycetota bacterium]|nr:tRNA (adenosine(37)-N6)-dimethylallyltransferase MiaA [Actinomycetota bacterium]